MSFRLYFYVFLFSAVLVQGCSQQAEKAEAKPGGDLMLLYMESEPGVEPYQSRLLINKDYMRMDDGKDEGDYTLYDRNKQTIYSVTHGEQSILKLEQVTTKNRIKRKLILDAVKLHDKDVPKVEGKSPVQYRLLVNNKSCSTIYAVKGLHPEAIAALREFRRILASVHLSKLNNTPSEMRDECFLAHEVQVPGRILQYGLTVYEASLSGFKRILVDYKNGVKHNPLLYKLPKAYRINTMTGAVVK